jgi:hypothetical protein
MASKLMTIATSSDGQQNPKKKCMKHLHLKLQCSLDSTPPGKTKAHHHQGDP